MRERIIVWRPENEERKTADEMLLEMFKLQLEEDRKVHEEFNISYFDLLEGDSYFSALLDEFGELNHEEKAEWCWWKKNVSQVDRDKVLEEFSDITHFVLSYCLALNSRIKEGSRLSHWLTYGEKPEGWKWDYKVSYSWGETISYLLKLVLNTVWMEGDGKEIDSYIRSALSLWNRLITLSEYTFELDVYEPYIEKNAINRQRVVDGY